jgi:hypothetical protein
LAISTPKWVVGHVGRLGLRLALQAFSVRALEGTRTPNLLIRRFITDSFG